MFYIVLFSWPTLCTTYYYILYCNICTRHERAYYDTRDNTRRVTEGLLLLYPVIINAQSSAARCAGGGGVRLSRVPKYLYIIFVGFDPIVRYTHRIILYCCVHGGKRKHGSDDAMYATIVIIIIVCASLIVLARPVNNLCGSRARTGRR